MNKPLQLLSAVSDITGLSQEDKAGQSFRAKREIGATGVVLWTLVLFIIIFFIWASLFTVEEITRGDGKVIPSGKVQVLQNLEGGIIQDILVKEGSEVKQGDVLFRLDQTKSVSELEDVRARLYHALASSARLRAQAYGTDLTFPESLIKEAPNIIHDQEAGYNAAILSLKSSVDSYNSQIDQKRLQVNRLRLEKESKTRESLLLSKEVEMMRPLVPQGALSEIELMRKERDLVALQSTVQSLSGQIPETERSISQLQAERDRFVSENKSKTLQDLSEQETKVRALTAEMSAKIDKMNRTDVSAPLQGLVKQVFVTTVGAVLQPGAPIAEIVPIEDHFIVEAKIKPSDIGFISVGQLANLKVTAYDSAIFGYLTGKVEVIGADTITERDGKEFYRVQVKTADVLRDKNGNPLSITAGMTISVDIVTGKKTILTYIFKPIVRGLNNAFRER